MIEVVKAGEKDYNVIRSLAEFIWPHTYSTILSADQLEYMFDMMYSNKSYIEQLHVKKHHFLLAKEDGSFVGFASYQLNYKSQTTKIHKLYVLPQTQGSGVGNKMVNAIEGIAVAHNNKTITLNVNRFNPAVNFYLKTGFSNVGQEDIHIGNGYLMEDYIMEKQL